MRTGPSSSRCYRSPPVPWRTDEPPTAAPRRHVTPLGLWTCHGWRLKLYALTIDGQPVESALVDEAKSTATTVLETATHNDAVGWLTLHLGASGRYVLVDWWVDRDIVQHRLFGALTRDAPLRANWPAGAAFCVWELAVCWHERQAWVQHVLARPHDPDYEGYLDDRISAWV